MEFDFSLSARSSQAGRLLTCWIVFLALSSQGNAESFDAHWNPTINVYGNVLDYSSAVSATGENMKTTSAVSTGDNGIARGVLFHAITLADNRIDLRTYGYALTGAQNGGRTLAQINMFLRFTTYVPMYYWLSGRTESRAMAQLTNTYTGERIAVFGGGGAVFPGTPSSGSFQGTLVPASYDLQISAVTGESAPGVASFFADFALTSAPKPWAITDSPTQSLFLPQATMNGRVNPNNVVTSAGFQYGRTTAYGNFESVTLSPNNGSAYQPVSVDLSNLEPGAAYHYRLIATDALGTEVSYGDDKTFIAGTDHTIIQFSSDSYTVNRDAFGIEIPVTLSGGTQTGAHVDFTMEDGTAENGVNYTAYSSTLHWDAGETTAKTFHISIPRHQPHGPPQTVILTLSNPGNAQLGSPARAILTINDTGDPEPPNPKVVSLGLTSATGIHLEGIAAPNSYWHVQSSSIPSTENFVNVATVLADPSGALHFEDNAAGSNKFYRFVSESDLARTNSGFSRKQSDRERKPDR